MAVYRIIRRAPSALHVQAFGTYNEALAYSRANGLQSKPIRRIEAGRIVWHVPTVGNTKGRAEYAKLPHWRPLHHCWQA